MDARREWSDRGRRAALLTAALVLGGEAAALSCGGEVRVQQGRDGGDGGGGDDSADAGADVCEDVVYPCTRFPEGDFKCAGEGKPALDYSCGDMQAISAECVFATDDCINCSEWCCPPEPWEGPTLADVANGSAGEATPPPGCMRTPADDYMCALQSKGKPPYAVWCPEAEGEEPCGPGGCCEINPYGTDCRPIVYAEFFCCPSF